MNPFARAAAALLLLAAPLAVAQEVAPLIIDEKPSVTVRTRPGNEEKDNQNPQGTPAPTPRPEEVFVALVNGRVMTQADLNARVTARYDAIRAEIQSQYGGILMNLNPAEETEEAKEAARERAAEEEILEEQKEHLDRAVRQEEGEAVQDWVEFSLLAEEARRQGIVVTDAEFEKRLDEAKRLNRINDEFVSDVLDSMDISQEDFERSVYDALMIEKLLQRFISLNFDLDYKRAAYDKNPRLFYEPEKFQIAHFSVAIPDEIASNKREISQLRGLAMRVRQALRDGKDPEAIFAEPMFDRPEDGIMGTIPGWFSFQDNMLPAIVEHEGRKMKVGEISDVLENYVREDGEVKLRSLHVVQILDAMPELGLTFETALPQIDRTLLEIARLQLVERLKRSGQHKVIISLSGIAPDKVPTRVELLEMERDAGPISLVMPRT